MEIFLSMMKSEFTLFEVKMKRMFGNTIKFCKPPFSI